jgi:multisubunit Na+/H+ antiporter MnhF subunit
MPPTVSGVLDFSSQGGQLVQAHDDTGAYQDSIKTAVRLILWTLAWVATLALAKFGPGLLWDLRQPVASWAAVATNLIVGIGWIVAFARFLRAQDEFQRKIIQDALAVALGVGWVGGFGYVVADAADLVVYDVDLAVLPVLLGGVYVIAIFIGKIRYR